MIFFWLEGCVSISQALSFLRRRQGNAKEEGESFSFLSSSCFPVPFSFLPFSTPPFSLSYFFLVYLFSISLSSLIFPLPVLLNLPPFLLQLYVCPPPLLPLPPLPPPLIHLLTFTLQSVHYLSLLSLFSLFVYLLILLLPSFLPYILLNE